jgi:hypothetical protein
LKKAGLSVVFPFESASQKNIFGAQCSSNRPYHTQHYSHFLTEEVFQTGFKVV